MIHDEIMASVRQARAELAAEAGHDLDKLAEKLRKSAEDKDHQVVTRPPKRPADWKQPAA